MNERTNRRHPDTGLDHVPGPEPEKVDHTRANALNMRCNDRSRMVFFIWHALY
jgi:hypothetical protein